MLTYAAYPIRHFESRCKDTTKFGGIERFCHFSFVINCTINTYNELCQKNAFYEQKSALLPRRECFDTPLPAGAPCGEWLRFLGDKPVQVIGVVFDNGKTLPDDLVLHGDQRQFP